MARLKRAKISQPQETMEGDDVTNASVEQMEPESDSEPELQPVMVPKKNAIYNEDGLLEKLEDISWPANLEWIQKLTIDHEQADEIDVEDDLAREQAFYIQALDGARKAFEKLQPMGLPFLRPSDYYAEMVKSDAHMLKVKGKVLLEKKKIEETEERKKARESKKIAKEVQAQKAKERAKRKKEDIESVKKWRKQRQQSGFARGKDEDLGMSFDDDNQGFERYKKRRPSVSPGDRSGGFGRRGGKQKGSNEKNKKREFRESKFGYGGRKGLKKQNTAATTNDLRNFNKGEMKRRKR